MQPVRKPCWSKLQREQKMTPLTDKRIVVTRAADQATEMVDELRRRGAQPLLMPCIATVALASTALDDALATLARYDWIVFTSTNAVRFLFAHPAALALTAELQNRQEARSPRVAVIGTATAAAFAEQGLAWDVMPDQFTGVDLGAALGDLRGCRVLLPRSRRGREETFTALTQQGAVVDDVALYDTVLLAPTVAMQAEVRCGVDAVTFTSPSTVEGFFSGVAPEAVAGVTMAAIGPTTAAALEDHGLPVHVQPDEFTVAALLDALEDYFAAHAQ